MHLEIFNETGQLIQQSSFYSGTGTQYLPLDANELSSGLYFVRIENVDGSEMISARFIRQ